MNPRLPLCPPLRLWPLGYSKLWEILAHSMFTTSETCCNEEIYLPTNQWQHMVLLAPHKPYSYNTRQYTWLLLLSALSCGWYKDNVPINSQWQAVPDMHCILWTTSGYIIEDWAVFTKDACGYNYMQSCELTVACLTCIVSQMETRPGSVAGHRVQAATADELHWLMQVSSASSMLWIWSEEPQIGQSHLPIAVQLFHWWNLVQ